MGEKIKDLSSLDVNNLEVKIELNDGYSPEYSKYDIHLQSNRLQYCMSERDFMKLVTLVITAKRKLDAEKSEN